MRDLADKIPGHNGLPLIGVLYKAFAIEAKGFKFPNLHKLFF